MDNSPDRSSPLRKTSYFQKYRKELERISQEMKTKNQSNSFSDKSEVKGHSKTNSNSEQTIPNDSNPKSTPNFSQPPPSLPPQSLFHLHQTITPSLHNPQPLKGTVKKSPVMQAQVEVPKLFMKKMSLREEGEHSQRDGEEEMSEVDLLMAELDTARAKLARYDEQVSQKRQHIDSLKRQLSQYPPLPPNHMQNYAEKMLAIETRMKFKKQLHEDELNRLVNERNQRHSENIELSKLIESLQEELHIVTMQQEKVEQPASVLQANVEKLQNEIIRLTQECAEVDLKINNSEELREMSVKEYRRYSEVYRRQLLGREVAQAQQRVKERNHQKRYLVQIQRKKMLVKERKIENGVRQKALIQLTRVIDHVSKQILALRKELNALNYDKGILGK